MGGNENVVEEGWRYGDVPGREVVPAAVVGVCESSVAESVNGDCAGCPVGSVMLQVSNVGPSMSARVGRAAPGRTSSVMSASMMSRSSRA